MNQEVEQMQRLSAALSGIDGITNDIATVIGDVKTRVQALMDEIKEAAKNPDSTAAITTLAQQAEEQLARLGGVKTELEGVGKPVETPEGGGTGTGEGGGTGEQP